MTRILFASVKKGHAYLDQGHWFFDEGQWGRMWLEPAERQNMTRSELLKGLMVFAAVLSSGLISAIFLDRYFADHPSTRAVALDSDSRKHLDALGLPSACVDADGFWKNWSWANVPMLSPECRSDR